MHDIKNMQGSQPYPKDEGPVESLTLYGIQEFKGFKLDRYGVARRAKTGSSNFAYARLRMTISCVSSSYNALT